MTAGSTVGVHHLLEGPEDAPGLVLSDSETRWATGWPP